MRKLEKYYYEKEYNLRIIRKIKLYKYRFFLLSGKINGLIISKLRDRRLRDNFATFWKV